MRSLFFVIACVSFPLIWSPASAEDLQRTLSVCEDSTPPPTLDPHKEFSDKIHTIIQQMYEGLVEFSPDGTIEPALAKSYRLIDPLTMEFSLRPGVTFHNGEPFDSRSVHDSIARYLDPATGFPARPLLDPITGSEIIDDLHIRIRTRTPDGLLLFRLAAFVVMVPSSVLSPDGAARLDRHPIGTGPFRFDSWTEDPTGAAESIIHLVKNGDYWDPRFPQTDRLEFRFLNMERALETFLNNSLDVIAELRGTLTLRVTKNPNKRIVKKASYITYLGTLNNQSGPLADKRVRRALNLAVDRDRLIRYFANGNGRPLATASMPDEFGHNEDLIPRVLDLDEARRLLLESGHGAGLSLKFLVKNTAREVMHIISRHWEAIGVKVDMKETNVADEIKDLRSRTWDGYVAATAEPMCHMAFLPGIGIYSKGPFSLTSHPAFDELYEELVTTTDLVRQASLCRDLDKLIYDEDLFMVTFQQIRTYAVDKRVSFEPSVTGMPRYKFGAIKEIVHGAHR